VIVENSVMCDRESRRPPDAVELGFKGADGQSESWSFQSEVLPPVDAPFDDREVSCGDLALDADLLAGVLGTRAAHHPLHCILCGEPLPRWGW
jgi:hypothetical protein